MKPGRNDVKLQLLICGEELSELQRHTWQMFERLKIEAEKSFS
ncbi:MAG: hypothetical protein AB7E77_08270 [Desulfobulbus sp.]